MRIYIYMPYVHNPESIRTILWTRLKKRNGRLGKLTIDMLGSLMITASDSKTKRTKPGSTAPACIITVRERMVEFYSD